MEGRAGLHPCSIVGQTDSFVYLFWPKSSAGAHQLLVLVCVVTPTESFRVVCGNAHPACFVLRARSFIVEAAQIGKVWRITRRKLSGSMAHTNFECTNHPQINLDSLNSMSQLWNLSCHHPVPFFGYYSAVLEGTSGILSLHV